MSKKMGHQGPDLDFGSHELCKSCLVATQNECPVHEALVNHFESLSEKFSKVSHKYPMESKHRGICLIISNKNFGGPREYTVPDVNNTTKTEWIDSDRHGTERDVESLSTVFDWLGFKVLLCVDQKAKEIKRVVKEISDLKEMDNYLMSFLHVQYLKILGLREYNKGEFVPLRELPKHGDAFICSILSHGGENGVSGVDHESVSINNLLSQFNGINCPNLIGKPKVFFIQACRGGKKMEIYKPPVKDNPTVILPDAEQKTDKILGSVRNYFPSEADFLVVEATVLHYVSYRNPVLGSFFIQALCHELILLCPKEKDILHILIEVNEKVSEETANQISEPTFTLRKKLVFPVPGPYPGERGKNSLLNLS